MHALPSNSTAWLYEPRLAQPLPLNFISLLRHNRLISIPYNWFSTHRKMTAAKKQRADTG